MTGDLRDSHGRYIQLLYEAYDANVAVDYYDLRSDDQKSADEYAALTERAANADRELIFYIIDAPVVSSVIKAKS